MIMYQT